MLATKSYDPERAARQAGANMLPTLPICEFLRFQRTLLLIMFLASHSDAITSIGHHKRETGDWGSRCIAGKVGQRDAAWSKLFKIIPMPFEDEILAV